MFETGKLGVTERKLAATEELLSVAEEEIRVLKIQLENTQKAHKAQQRNTGAFWESTRAAERKLKAIRELVESDDESREKIRDIKQVLDGE